MFLYVLVVFSCLAAKRIYLQMPVQQQYLSLVLSLLCLRSAGEGGRGGFASQRSYRTDQTTDPLPAAGEFGFLAPMTGHKYRFL